MVCYFIMRAKMTCKPIVIFNFGQYKTVNAQAAA
jgi:hypothetical protein